MLNYQLTDDLQNTAKVPPKPFSFQLNLQLPCILILQLS